jgi:hypothetical protein
VSGSRKMNVETFKELISELDNENLNTILVHPSIMKEYWQMTRVSATSHTSYPVIILQILMVMMISGKHYRGVGVVNTFILMMIHITHIYQKNANYD